MQARFFQAGPFDLSIPPEARLWGGFNHARSRQVRLRDLTSSRELPAGGGARCPGGVASIYPRSIQPRHASHGIHRKLESVYLIQNGHIEPRCGCSFFFITSDVNIVVARGEAVVTVK